MGPISITGYFKVIRNNSFQFQTDQFTIMRSDIDEYGERIKKCLNDQSEVIFHEVRILEGKKFMNKGFNLKQL